MPTENFERLDTARIAQILSVALDEFTRYSYRDASFNRIIRSCQMAKGTMYYYFKSKDDLFLTLYKATVREFSPLLRLAQRPVDSADEFWVRTRELLEGLQMILAHKASIGLFVTNFLKPQSLAQDHPAAATIQAIDRWLQEYLSRGQELKALRGDLSAARLTALSWALWESCRPHHMLSSGENLLPLEAEQLIDLLDRLLKPAVSSWRGRDLRESAPTL